MDLRKDEAILEYKLDLATEKGIKIGEEKGIKIGQKQGKIEGKIEVAKNLLKAGLSIDLIADATGLSLDEL